MLTVRARPSWYRAGRVASPLIAFGASVAFVTGGARGGTGFAAMGFLVLGVLGIAFFGAGTVLAAGNLLGRRPVLELDEQGVRRPAPWPRRRRRDRVLPWPQVEALCLVSRGVAARGSRVRDHLVFLSSPQAAEHARTAPKPQLVALVLTDLPGGSEHAPWLLMADPDWNVPLKDIVAEVRRHGVPIIDRRRK
ncbi:hypothetical protein SAMN04489712_105118 [Thermomonospora echinospora]|uniref:PH domain-containing protein n=1 Tax=Thermomonospora echinospora TaxID=1992 RepID=A0A1H6A066_9ACTN|nr:hypothetical protein [Thermomonospora echinospora]SEG42128.1 hypothetical protein SAMN04489712_105118 [Thermomonospora echinospora]